MQRQTGRNEISQAVARPGDGSQVMAVSELCKAGVQGPMGRPGALDYCSVGYQSYKRVTDSEQAMSLRTVSRLRLCTQIEPTWIPLVP